MGCKNNQMYLFWTRDSHFVECSFWFWVHKFLPNGIRPADNNFVTRTKKGWRNRCHPDFFQYSCGFPGFLGPIFQNRPTVDVQPPKEQKQQKTAFLLLLRKAVFSFFRHRQRNDFWWSVQACTNIFLHSWNVKASMLCFWECSAEHFVKKPVYMSRADI